MTTGFSQLWQQSHERIENNEKSSQPNIRRKPPSGLRDTDCDNCHNCDNRHHYSSSLSTLLHSHKIVIFSLIVFIMSYNLPNVLCFNSC